MFCIVCKKMHLEHGQGVALLQTKLNHSLPEHHSSSGFDLNILQMLKKAHIHSSHCKGVI